MTTPKTTTPDPDLDYCADCGDVLGPDELVCQSCGAPTPGFCAEGYDPEDFDDEDQRLDDPRHGQAAGLNRDNRGRE